MNDADANHPPGPPPPRGAATTGRQLPFLPVLGFLAFLAVVFAASWGVGSLAGPVAPDLRPGPGEAPTGGVDGEHEGDGGQDEERDGGHDHGLGGW